MTMDGKGNNHQPKGTPGAGRFAAKAGAMDDSDLNGGFDAPAGPVPEYVHNRREGWAYAHRDDMADFRAALPVEPVAMGDRDYGEAAAVRATDDGWAVDLYSGLHPAMALDSSEGYETREEAEQAAHDAIASDDSVLGRFERESLDRFTEAYGLEPYDEDTVVIYEDDGQIEVRFDADTAVVNAYSGNGNHMWTDGAELRDGDTLDDYLGRVASATAAL